MQIGRGLGGLISGGLKSAAQPPPLPSPGRLSRQRPSLIVPQAPLPQTPQKMNHHHRLHHHHSHLHVCICFQVISVSCIVDFFLILLCSSHSLSLGCHLGSHQVLFLFPRRFWSLSFVHQKLLRLILFFFLELFCSLLKVFDCLAVCMTPTCLLHRYRYFSIHMSNIWNTFYGFV